MERLKPPPALAQSSSSSSRQSRQALPEQQVPGIVPSSESGASSKFQGVTRVSAFSDMTSLTSERSSMRSSGFGPGRLQESIASPITSASSGASEMYSQESIELVPLRFASLANLASIGAFGVGDLTIQLSTSEPAEPLETSCEVLIVVYVVLVLVLLFIAAKGSFSVFYLRPAHMCISFGHVALGLASIQWRADLAGKSWVEGGHACTVALMLLLVVALYPEDTCSIFIASLISICCWFGLWLNAGAPFSVLAEGSLVIFGATFACLATSVKRWSADAGDDQCSSKVHTEEISNDVMQAILRPIFEAESCVLTPSNEDPQVATRLDRLTRRLAMAKFNLAGSDVSENLRSPLDLVFTTMLDELKQASSLYLLPMVELAGASPMTLEYVAKTLNQAAAVNTVASDSCNEQTPRKPEHGDDRKSQDTADEIAERLSSSVATTYVSTTTSSLACDSGKSNKEDDHEFDNFDEAVTSMMSPLVFSEYWDKLPPPCITPAVQAVLSKDLTSWSFDVFQLSRMCEERPLCVVGKHAMQARVEELGLQLERLESFLEMIESRYHSTNLYHNSMHGADVLNSVAYFLQLPNTRVASLTALECLSALVAASAHDVGHTSQANRFHVSAQTPLSMLYNDQSVLENLHCTLTFAVLRSQSSNFVAGLEASQASLFRGCVVKLILDTDLSKHIENVSRFRQEFLTKAAGEAITISSPPTASTSSSSSSDAILTLTQRKELLSFILKASDVSGSTKPFDLHVKWTLRINSEFFEQGDAERNLGLPCSPFCDRKGTDIAESQRGFFDFIVMPLYSAFDEFLDIRRLRLEVLPELEHNRRFWKSYDHISFDYSNPMANEDMLRRCFARSVNDWSSMASNPPTLLTADAGQNKHAKAAGRSSEIASSATMSQTIANFAKAIKHPLDTAGEADEHVQRVRSRSLSSLPALGSGNRVELVS